MKVIRFENTLRNTNGFHLVHDDKVYFFSNIDGKLIIDPNYLSFILNFMEL